MVEAMGGALEVESAEGSGSTFCICLPAAAAQGSALPAEGQPEPLPVATPAAERLVLYIEDNPANVLLMEELVGRLPGVRLVSAHTAEIGIALAHQERPDLVIMDINLPGMDGFQALATLRSARETQDIPVIALSANAMPKAVSRGLAAGFRSYHTKPIQIEAFMRTVREILEGVAS
jgi:CheY-like chemotaxis protein